MPRDLSLDFANELEKPCIFPAYFIKLEIEPDPVYIWTGLGPVNFLGETFLGGAHIGSVETLRESAAIKAESVKFSLFCLPDTDVADLESRVYRGRRAEIYLVMLSDACEVLASDLRFCGLMQTIRVKRSPKRLIIELTAANELIRLRQRWGLFHTDADQRRIDPTDTSHRFIPSMQNAQVTF